MQEYEGSIEAENKLLSKKFNIKIYANSLPDIHLILIVDNLSLENQLQFEQKKLEFQKLLHDDLMRKSLSITINSLKDIKK